MPTLALRFGYSVPEGAQAAWGARWIINQDGLVDQVWDRTDAVGEDEPRQRLLDHLRDVVGVQPHRKLQTLLENDTVNTRTAEEVVLYEDDTVKVFGNTNASSGYFYVTAYLK